jgi:hypothetical protein
MSDTQKRYGISKELADKIDRDYDEMFANDAMKGAYNYIWNAAIEAAAKVAEYNAVTSEEIRKLKK